MKIGIPKEIKINENRVGMTPEGIKTLLLKYSYVTFYVQNNAGEGSGFSDEMYREAGAQIVNSAAELYHLAELIVKVKEPLKEEYHLINSKHTVFTFFHFASSLELTEAMLKSKSQCIAYETVQKNDGSLPILTPMSEVAGRLSIQQGAKYLEKIYGGKGKLLGGIPGVMPAKVLILGGGVVGVNAAKMAAGLGAHVFLFELNSQRIRALTDILPANVTVLFANKATIKKHLTNADLIIGAVLIPGAKAPKLLDVNDLKLLEKGTVLVDVAIDQGGCFETSKATSHLEPIYIKEGVVHYCVANMPGAVPQTSTLGLTYATLPYIDEIIKYGCEHVVSKNKEIAAGLSINNGVIIDKAVEHFYNSNSHI